MKIEIYKDKLYITTASGSIIASLHNIEIKRLNNILECFRDNKLVMYIDLREFEITDME